MEQSRKKLLGLLKHEHCVEQRSAPVIATGPVEPVGDAANKGDHS